MTRGPAISRSTVALDRAALAVLGLAAVALGGATALDRAGVVDVRANPVLADAASGPDQRWWPWAVGAAGVVLVLVGLRWVLAHLAVRRAGPLRLDGSGAQGRLDADAGSLADSAADRVGRVAGVVSASGHAVVERGGAAVVVNASASPHVDPVDLQPGLDEALADLAAVAGPAVPVRVELTVARRAARV